MSFLRVTKLESARLFCIARMLARHKRMATININMAPMSMIDGGIAGLYHWDAFIQHNEGIQPKSKKQIWVAVQIYFFDYLYFYLFAI